MAEQEGAVTKETLLQSAAEFDAKGEFGSLDEAEGVSVEPKLTDPEPEASGDGKAVEPVAETKPDPDSSAKESQTQEESKPKSKWAANEERKSRTWKDINSEKEGLKREREEMETEKSRLRSERDEFSKTKAQPDADFRDEKGHSVSDYEAAAVKFDDEGDSELAGLARDRANKVKSLEMEGRSKRAVDEFHQKWTGIYNKIADKDPDMKNEQSDTYKGVADLLRRFPLLTQNPDGLNYAYEAVIISKKGRDFESSKAENAKLREEIGKYQKKLAIGGGVATGPLEGERSFDKLSRDEQRKRLMSASEDFDRASR